MMLNRPNLIEDSDGIGYGNGYGDEYGDGYGDGLGDGYGCGDGRGNEFDEEEEQLSAIRLLSDAIQNINFYICQLHLMRKTK